MSDEEGEVSEEPASFPVAGIGASAGGLEALTAIVKDLMPNGMALVVVQHLSPHHDSALPVLLGRAARMPVVEITDGLRVEPDHIYVAPPNVQVALLHGTLQLLEPACSLPIDFFFRTLAQDLGPRAIAVVLSGMGSDGTFGLKAVKERGGITLAQDPQTAKFDNMPQSAISAGAVDRILAPDALAAELSVVAKHPYILRPTPAPSPRPEGLLKLFVLLRAAFGNDLSGYKQTTIERRLERRMAVQKIDKLDRYVQFAQAHPDELQALYRDILINVTSFFRDADVFGALKAEILPRIVERTHPGQAIRIWVPACSSGEEAYSIAICLLEVLGPRSPDFRVQIFGTDVDDESIATARRGLYPPNIELDVSAERLDRFFVRSEGNYVVNRRVRDMIVFSTQNVVKDAPFARVDLACCRNLLIYMQAPLQKKILRLLHYALRPEGYLLLGSSETIGDLSDLFILVDRQHKFFMKKTATAATGHLSAAVPSQGDGTTDSSPRVHPERRGSPTAQQLADRRIIERYAPPSVLVNENLDIIQFRGDTGPYLAPASGAATLNVLRLVRPELHVDLWRAIQQAGASEGPAPRSVVRVEAHRGGAQAHAPRRLWIEVSPLEVPDTKGRCLLIVFSELPSDGAESDAAAGPSLPPAPDRVSSLEQELDATKEFLQTTIEELESSNEELKSTNEELQSSNEEMQSTNEELETSKEELQSTNEELTTVNDELQHRLADLARRSNELTSLLRTVRDPIVFLGPDGRITRFTEAAERLLNLVSTDLGRTLQHLRPFMSGLDLDRLVSRALERLAPASEDVCAADRRWYTVTVRPYSASEGTIDGALLCIDDIDAERRSTKLTIDVNAYADKVLGAILQPLVIVDEKLRVIWANAPFLEFFDLRAADVLGGSLKEMEEGAWSSPEFLELLDVLLRNGVPFREFVTEKNFPRVGPRRLKVSGSRILGIGREERVVVLTMVGSEGGVGAR